MYFYVALSNQDSHSIMFNLAYLSLWALLLVTPELGKVLVKGWMIKEGRIITKEDIFRTTKGVLVEKEFVPFSGLTADLIKFG